MVNGGYSLDAETDVFPGNFAVAGKHPRWLVYEVDESDRSLSAFTPDYGVLLNVGNDHYSQDELRVVFAGFLERCRHGVAVLAELADLAAGGPQRQALFAAEETSAPGVLYPMEYTAGAQEFASARRVLAKSRLRSQAVIPRSMQLRRWPCSACLICRIRRRRWQVHWLLFPVCGSALRSSGNGRMERLSSTTMRTIRRRLQRPCPRLGSVLGHRCWLVSSRTASGRWSLCERPCLRPCAAHCIPMTGCCFCRCIMPVVRRHSIRHQSKWQPNWPPPVCQSKRQLAPKPRCSSAASTMRPAA